MLYSARTFCKTITSGFRNKQQTNNFPLIEIKKLTKIRALYNIRFQKQEITYPFFDGNKKIHKNTKRTWAIQHPVSETNNEQTTSSDMNKKIEKISGYKQTTSSNGNKKNRIDHRRNQLRQDFIK